MHTHTHARKHFVSLANECQALLIQQNKQTHPSFLMEITLLEMRNVFLHISYGTLGYFARRFCRATFYYHYCNENMQL